jgi:prevent-host-death family protein
MKTMAAGQFKARCLQVMETVRTTGVPLLITKRGKPVAKLVPPDEAPARALGRLAGKIEILGDIVSPVVPPEDWESLK